LLAFVSSDATSSGMTVTSVAGASLNWVLVRRTNAQPGTAEVWRAFAPTRLSNVTVSANLSQSVAASITVVSFTGVDTSGANGSAAIGATGSGSASSGAPAASLVTTRNDSWVFGVGSDWDNAIARTLPSTQSLVNQYLATVGDTYWVQRQNAPTAASGTTVTISAMAPTTDRYNLTIVEVLAAPVPGNTYAVSGTIAPASLGSAATVTLSQNATTISTTTADAGGNYTFPAVANGTYTVTPVKSGVNFSPTSQNVTVNGGPATVTAFSATATISGTISPASSGAGTLVTLTGPNQLTLTTTATASGVYGFSGLAAGNYTVVPSKTGYSFNPTSQAIAITTGGATADFTATLQQSYTISGTVSPAAAGSGTLVRLGSSPSRTTTADSSGNYSFTGLASGTYPVTPTKSGYMFTPASRSVTVNGADVAGVNFTAQAQPAGLYPDFSVIIPTNRMSIVGSGASRMFQYTHQTFNGGPGPLEIEPVYNPASGTYQGIQRIYSFSGGTWTLVQQIPIAGAFIFHAQHGHFHFPLATYGLYTVAGDGGIGTLAALSEKNGFCINDSFLLDRTLPNAGALGNLGTCTDPTTLRGLNIGAVDEYDQTDVGQSISLVGVPDGTYWLRVIVDPNNFLAESDKSNNETDVLLTISGNTVTANRTVVPILSPPPDITLSSPADQTVVSGMATLTASPASGAAVQFLLDGQPLGSAVSSPYMLAWDTRTVPNGSHWIAAQTTDPTSGITGTSAVARVTVGNSGSNPPVVTVTSPEAGSTVSAIITMAATVASAGSIARVQFYVDDAPLGAPLTAPPFLMPWDTRTATDGQHTITASATDTSNLTGTSSPVTVTVDNSHPSQTIRIDASVFRDTSDTMTTPAFSTTTTSALLVAFVAYDGPAGAPQTASVSGAGLTWTLVQRSNIQSGTAEIWAAKADGILTNVTVTSEPTVSGFHGSLVVVAFTNAAGLGVSGRRSAPSGAPDIFLPGISAGNWVFAVGNDWDGAITRTPVNGQVLVHQRVDTTVGDTFWVQSTATPSAANGIVTIHDNSPTTNQWNYAAVEIVATRQ